MNRVNATGTVIRIPVMKMLRRRRFRLLNMMNEVGEWDLRHYIGCAVSRVLSQAIERGGVGISYYYIVIYREGKRKGRGIGV